MTTGATKTPNRETRRAKGVELRAIEEDGEHYIDLLVIVPNIVDEYGSVFLPETFDRSLAERLPTLTYGHSWHSIIGRAVSYTRAEGEGPVVRFRLDDFDAVPLAHQAYAQVSSGTIDDCSVGFSNTSRREPKDVDLIEWPGCREVIEDADLDETALVLRGAVPGAKVVGIRTASGIMVDEASFETVFEEVKAGTISVDEGKLKLELLGTGAEPPADTTPPEPTAEQLAEQAQAQATADALAAELEADVDAAREQIGL